MKRPGRASQTQYIQKLKITNSWYSPNRFVSNERRAVQVKRVQGKRSRSPRAWRNPIAPAHVAPPRAPQTLKKGRKWHFQFSTVAPGQIHFICRRVVGPDLPVTRDSSATRIGLPGSHCSQYFIAIKGIPFAVDATLLTKNLNFLLKEFS